MPKTSTDFDLGEYATVADRLTLFYSKHPNGRVMTDLISRENGEITFKASVYRTAEEQVPAATGWASEIVGDGSINEVACLENTETSAIGRALANLGFTASRMRPSAEEMRKVERARTKSSSAIRTGSGGYSTRQSPPQLVREGQGADRELQTKADIGSDVIRFLEEAVRAGAPDVEVETSRKRLMAPEISLSEVKQLELRWRQWLIEHRASGESPPQHEQS